MLKPRLLERGDVTHVALPPWALDPARGNCTTLVLLAPVPTQLILHLRPMPGLPSALGSSAGALQLTRCGQDRFSLLSILVEMRSPRAVIHTVVAVGSAAPLPLAQRLPERAPGPVGSLGDPGPAPPRDSLPERLERFALEQTRAGALSTETRALNGRVRLSLLAGCHRLLVSQSVSGPYVLELREGEQDKPKRVESSGEGDTQQELCSARDRAIWLSVDAAEDAEVRLVIARFALPVGLPGRFGPEVAEQLALSLGGPSATTKLGPLVSATLGAQGRTPLPRQLLPQTCYVAAVIALHGDAQTLSLGVQAGPSTAEASSESGGPGPRLGFCTGQRGEVALDVEARGLGMAWLLFLFQVGPARPVVP